MSIARKLDYIIVVDLEATCWAPDEPAGDSEIIQIGSCCLDVRNLSIHDSSSIYIRPTRSSVSEFCTALTGLTWEFLRVNGIPFDGAINTFKKRYGPKHRIWATWGNWDRWKLGDDCSIANVPFPCGASHINIKELHAVKRKLPRSLGLGSALRHEGLSFEGKEHNGEDDAINAARVMQRILG